MHSSCTGRCASPCARASDYEFFLAAGLGVATALQLLLISGGALGVLPLSGVVTPFLSYGRTAMLANFLVFGILLHLRRAAARMEQRTRRSARP